MTTEGTGTVSTKPTAWNLELLFTVLALLAQAFIAVELFAPETTAGKLVSVVGIVLTGLGYTVSRAKAVKAVLSTAMLVGLFVLFVAQFASGCSAGQRGGRIAADVIDCMAPDAARATGELLPAFADVIRNATSPDGAVDGARIKSVGRSLLGPATRCAFAAALNEALRPRAKDPQAPLSAELLPNAAQLRAAFEDLRGEWGGPRFKLEGGTL